MKMKLKKIKIGEKDVMPFTIPSGIVMTDVRCAARILQMNPAIGIWTTKSIGPEPRKGYREPIFAEYTHGSYVNAVGLTNPGCEEFARELASVDIPGDRFILASIFGANSNEFVRVAKTLEGLVDGFELNLSCPHVQGHGMLLGQDKAIVYEITREVVEKIKKPVFVKLTPNAINLGEIAQSAISAGAYGITAINTVGPGLYMVDGHPVLTNQVGGLSGRAIKPIGLKCVREIRQAIGEKPVIIGMGGIECGGDVSDYKLVGANAFGIGSVFVGMDEEHLNNYLESVVEEAENESHNLGSCALGELLYNSKYASLDYCEAKIIEIVNPDCDFRVVRTNIVGGVHLREFSPGQFLFAWIPGVGEKPFSIMDDDPLTLGVLERGEFTKHFNSLKKGDSFYVRGPYGKSVGVPSGSDVVLVGGGCGIAGIYSLAKEFSNYSNVMCLVGARNKNHAVMLEDFKKFGKLSGRVQVATEDGSLGRKGMVSDLFSENSVREFSNGAYFFNCGPRAMIEAVLPLELKVTNPERIYFSVDYMTKCGVGICGSCADKTGRRSCVEGPFMR
jgi:dihydroorotate dehydrogenase subfamily 1